MPEVGVRAADDHDVVLGEQHRVDAVLRPHDRRVGRLAGTGQRGGQLRQEGQVLDRQRVVDVLDALGQLAVEDVRRDRDAQRGQVDRDPGPALPVGEQRQQQLVLPADVPPVARNDEQRPARLQQHPQAGAVDRVVAAGGEDLPHHVVQTDGLRDLVARNGGERRGRGGLLQECVAGRHHSHGDDNQHGCRWRCRQSDSRSAPETEY